MYHIDTVVTAVPIIKSHASQNDIKLLMVIHPQVPHVDQGFLYLFGARLTLLAEV